MAPSNAIPERFETTAATNQSTGPEQVGQPRHDLDLSGLNTLRELSDALSHVSSGGLTHRHGILDFVFSVGAILNKAHGICLSGQDGDNPAPTWGDWLDDRRINRDRACKYMRVYKNWKLVDQLKGRERTLTHALAVIDETLKGHPNVPRRKVLDVSYSLALEMMQTFGFLFAVVPTPEAVEKFLNWAIGLAGSKKLVRVCMEAEATEEVKELVTHALQGMGEGVRL